MLSIFRLYINGPSPLVSFSDPDYLDSHFIGQSEMELWRRPEVYISGRTKPLKDMMMGAFQAPIVSEKFRHSLIDFTTGCAEFLPLTELKGRNLYVLNVIKLVDCLNIEGSDVLYASDEPGKILHIGKYVFDEGRLENVPLFKLPQDVGNVFVSERFLQKVRDHGLSGIGVDDLGDIRLAKGDSPVAGFPS